MVSLDTQVGRSQISEIYYELGATAGRAYVREPVSVEQAAASTEDV